MNETTSDSVRNVLFIMCDQLRLDALSCFGGTVIETPNIDRLAARGVRFDQAHVQGSVCGSSRMSFYTGRYVQSHGARYNRIPLSIGQRTLGDHLRSQGVRTMLIGKTHMAPDRDGLATLGLDPDAPEAMYLAECGFEPTLRDDGLMPGVADRSELPYNRFLAEHGFGGPNAWHTAANSVLDEDGRRVSGWLLRASKYPAIVPDELSETAFMTDQAIDTIRAAGDDPWCIHLSFIKPHWPYVVSEPFHDLVDPLDLPAPNRSDTELEHDHPVLQAFRDLRVSRAFSDDDIRRTVYPAYLGLVLQIDRHLGRLFAELDRLGRTDDTMIVLTSDHGDYMGDHWLGEKDWLHDEVVRVPMIVVDPRPAADVTRGTVSSELVEAIDLVPTFVDATGEITPEIDRWLEGQPLTPLLHGQPQEREMAICQSEFAYVELGPTDDPRRRRATMLRTDRFKYILSETGPDLLYDLDDDPSEQRDRGDDPGLADERAELKERLFEWFRDRSNETTLDLQRQLRSSEHGLTASAQGVLIGYWDEAAAAADGADHHL